MANLNQPAVQDRVPDVFVAARGELYKRQLEAEQATREEKKVNNQKVKELVK